MRRWVPLALPVLLVTEGLHVASRTEPSNLTHSPTEFNRDTNLTLHAGGPESIRNCR